jgi:hypothetical protein
MACQLVRKSWAQLDNSLTREYKRRALSVSSCRCHFVGLTQGADPVVQLE